MSSLLAIVLFPSLFFFSGVVVNVVQILCLIFLWPFSKRLYRIVNGLMADAFWSEMVWLAEWWAGVKIRLYADEATWKILGTEHALVISNHRSDVDWLIGWVVAKRRGCLGGAKALMKSSLGFLPLIGWSMWFLEFIFLRRNWAKDEATLKVAYDKLRGYPRPFWMVLFVEGTRFTQAKLLDTQEFARSNGMNVPKHVLIPRTKGFVSAVQHLRSFVPALYDFTIVIPKTSDSPTMASILNGKSSEVHLYVRRYGVEDLPGDDAAIAKFCRDVFVEKDKRIDKYFSEGGFDEKLYIPSKPSRSSVWVTLAWAIFLAGLSFALALWALKTGALTRNGIGILTAVPVFLGLLLKIMMLSTRAELGATNRRAKQRALMHAAGTDAAAGQAARQAAAGQAAGGGGKAVINGTIAAEPPPTTKTTTTTPNHSHVE